MIKWERNAGQCQFIKTGQCQFIKTGQCQFIKTGQCQFINTGQCQFIKTGQCQFIKTGQCQFIKTGQCQIIKTGSQFIKMNHLATDDWAAAVRDWMSQLTTVRLLSWAARTSQLTTVRLLAGATRVSWRLCGCWPGLHESIDDWAAAGRGCTSQLTTMHLLAEAARVSWRLCGCWPGLHESADDCAAAGRSSMIRNQLVLSEWLSQPPDSIVGRGRNMYNWKNMCLKNKMCLS